MEAKCYRVYPDSSPFYLLKINILLTINRLFRYEFVGFICVSNNVIYIDML